MAKLNPNRFSSYTLSEAELKEGLTFNIYQLRVIQNMIAEAANEKISLVFDPTNPSEFIQREAELHGQINVLEYLIAASIKEEENTELQLGFEETL